MLEVGWLQWVAAQAKSRVVLTNIAIPITFRQFLSKSRLNSGCVALTLTKQQHQANMSELDMSTTN